jgi:hypothetical protein
MPPYFYCRSIILDKEDISLRIKEYIEVLEEEHLISKFDYQTLLKNFGKVFKSVLDNIDEEEILEERKRIEEEKESEEEDLIGRVDYIDSIIANAIYTLLNGWEAE